MRTFKISKKTNEVVSKTVLDPGKYILTLSGDSVCLEIDRDYAIELNEGSRLHFEKTASGNTGQMLKVHETDVLITKIVDSGNKRYVYFDYTYIQPLVLSSMVNIGSGDYNYKVYLTTDTLMAPGDFEKYGSVMGAPYKFYIKRGSDSVLCFNDLALCYPGGFVKGEDISDDGGYCCEPGYSLFNYETMERDSILAKSMTVVAGSAFTPSAGDTVLLCTNPFYFVHGEDIVELFDNVVIERYTDYMGLGVKLDQDYDSKRLFQEHQVNELFVKRIKNSIIPDFIDLEKIKYSPAFVPDELASGDTGAQLATGLTFNLHFRTRVSGDTRYTFEDVWHTDDLIDTWNGNGISDPPRQQDSLYTDEDFVNSSNLLGYLGFTDDDVYNQKNRVKQSFIRLLFYDGKNPLTQSLLCYSTIFFDSGELYGRYVKKKSALIDKDEDYDETKNPVVWSPTGLSDTVSAVTSELRVNDEYDMTKSGEGFNLYLFRQDAPIENYPEDIYMRIEFNHAGYGRTVPFIVWPKDERTGFPAKLTIENYLDSLYIKVKVALTDRGYIYYFPDTVSAEEEDGRLNGIVWENDRLVFNIFEPRITPDDFSEEE